MIWFLTYCLVSFIVLLLLMRFSSEKDPEDRKIILIINKNLFNFESMKKIDIKKIIEVKKLDPKQVANELFPGNKYPKMALDRVLAGEGVLDADQISRFSLYTGIPIAELYSGANWQSTIKGQNHILVSGHYRAELNTETWTTKLFHKDSLFHEFIIHSSSISLGDYIQRLNTEISKKNK